MLSIRLEDDLLAQVRRQANARGVSMSKLVRDIVVESLNAKRPQNALEAFGDYVGFISCGPTPLGQGDELGDILEEKHQREAAVSRAARERRRVH